MAIKEEVKPLNLEINESLIKERLQTSNVSCTSMVVNVLGDVVSQHGGWIWLGSLINALEPFGYNERLVRTAVYRLIQQEWLQVRKIGRRSFYSFTDMANRYYEKAARRIYASRLVDWDGYWTLVCLVGVPEDQKDGFRKSLLWQGFNPLVNGIYAHPSAERASLDETLYELDLVGRVVIFTAKTEDVHSHISLRDLVQEKWNLEELQALYRDFLEFFRPLARNLSGEMVSNQTCFMLRCLAIHDYRRILLRDPDFPKEMLPDNWEGYEAYELMKYLYKRLAFPSIQYIQEALENDEGKLPEPDEYFYRRFDGILKFR